MLRTGRVGEDERDHAAETDAAIPEHGRQRNISDRADERDYRDQGPDDRSPDIGENRLIDQKERLPEIWRDPSGERAGNEHASHDIHPYRGPIRHEVVADRRQTLFGGYPLPKRATLADRHVHLGMAFHAAHDALVGLLHRFAEKLE